MQLNFDHLFLFLAGFSLIGCEEADCPMPDRMPLVVEGWICEGETPVIMITRAVNLTEDSPSFDDKVEKWCRVSIFDNGDQHILGGKLDNSYTPAFIYTDNTLKGRPGHSYRLLIETDEETFSAKQTILPSPQIDRIEPRNIENSDSLYTLQVFLKDLPAGGHYRIFTRTIRLENRLYSSFLGSGDNDLYNPETGISVTRGIHSGFSDTHFDHFFHSGETVIVKVCSADDSIHSFWQSYDRNISMSQNLFFTFAENCPGNITHALGYWAAYGTSTAAVRIP